MYRPVLFGVFLTLVCFVASSAALAKPGRMHFVFDMDDTIIRWVHPGEKPGGTILPGEGDIDGYRYRVLDGAPEIIASILHDYPDALISFDSAGPRERNLRILSELMLPDGRSAKDIAYRILSKEDLPPDGKKDLRKVLAPGDRIEDVILLDDHTQFSELHQEWNLLWVGAKPELHEVEVGDAGARPDAIPEFLKDRNKLVRARGLIDRMIALANARDISLSEALDFLQWGPKVPGPIEYRSKLQTDLDLYRSGLRDFVRVNPRFRFTTALPGLTSIGCVGYRLRLLLLKANRAN